MTDLMVKNNYKRNKNHSHLSRRRPGCCGNGSRCGYELGRRHQGPFLTATAYIGYFREAVRKAFRIRAELLYIGA